MTELIMLWATRVNVSLAVANKLQVAALVKLCCDPDRVAFRLMALKRMTETPCLASCREAARKISIAIIPAIRNGVGWAAQVDQRSVHTRQVETIEPLFSFRARIIPDHLR